MPMSNMVTASYDPDGRMEFRVNGEVVYEIWSDETVNPPFWYSKANGQYTSMHAETLHWCIADLLTRALEERLVQCQ